MHSSLALLSLLLAALAAHAQYGRVHQAQLNVRLAHSHQSLPLPNVIVEKGRKGDTSITETLKLGVNDCFQKLTWISHHHLGVHLVGTIVNVTMDQPNDPLPLKITIDPLSVVNIERGVPCEYSGVAIITWEVDYVIPHTTKKPKVADHPPVAVDRHVERTTPPYITVVPPVQPVAVARHIGIIWV